MQIAASDLKPIPNVNTRESYDLRYNAKSRRFKVSQDIYHKYDLQNHGFRIFVTPQEQVVLVVVPNEHADIHNVRRGAEGSTKGYEFTARTLTSCLNTTPEANTVYSLELIDIELNVEETAVLLVKEMGQSSITAAPQTEDPKAEQQQEYTY